MKYVSLFDLMIDWHCLLRGGIGKLLFRGLFVIVSRKGNTNFNTKLYYLLTFQNEIL